MSSMFHQAKSFNGDLSKWDVSNVVHMPVMFMLSPFNGDLSKWNVSNVTRMYEMFRGSSFNGDISDWDIQKVTDMGGMLTDSSISEANYDRLLTKWAALPILQSNVMLGAEGLTYCNAVAARNTLTNDKGWTISGDRECPR